MNIIRIHKNIMLSAMVVFFVMASLSWLAMKPTHDIYKQDSISIFLFCGSDQYVGVLRSNKQPTKGGGMKREIGENSAVQEALPKAATIVRPAQRSKWVVNSRNKQRVLVIADDSGSMSGAKAQQAHAGCQELNDALAAPENKNGFYVGAIFFNEDARIAHPWIAATALVGNIMPLNPSGYTNIASALEMALTMLKDAEKQDDAQKEVTYLRSIAFLYSDGMTNRGNDPRLIATEVKKICDLVTVAIGSDSDDKLLTDLATSPAHFYKVPDAVGLRKFLADAGPTVMQSFQKGEAATVIVTQIKTN